VPCNAPKRENEARETKKKEGRGFWQDDTETDIESTEKSAKKKVVTISERNREL
jgi:endonuclease YncB( thermonuclease family)